MFKARVWSATSIASFPACFWVVSYPGKKDVKFERWMPAMVFALYVVRHPHVMQDAE